MRRVSRLLLLTTTLCCGVFYVHEVCAQNPGTAPSANKLPDTDSLRGLQKITGELMEEQDALLRFRVTDSATKPPLINDAINGKLDVKEAAKQ